MLKRPTTQIKTVIKSDEIRKCAYIAKLIIMVKKFKTHHFVFVFRRCTQNWRENDIT